MKRITSKEFRREATKLYGPDPIKWKVICPLCKTKQSAEDLINAGVKKEEAHKYIGIFCIGRWINSGPYDKTKSKGKGCDLSLGGLFKAHRLEIIDYKGDSHPCFEIALLETDNE